MRWHFIGQSLGLFLVVSIVTAAGATEADEFPSLKPGLWEFQRAKGPSPGVGSPPNASVRKCVDPSADMKQKWKQLAANECQFSPIAHVGDRFTYRSVCRRQEIEVLISSVVTVESDSAYQVKTQSRASGGTSNEVVVARRVGDCASAAQMTTRGTQSSARQ